MLLLLLLLPSLAFAGVADDIASLAGDGTVYVVDDAGTVLVDHNADRSFIPASTLKVVTSLLAIEHLGLDYRFQTSFFVNDGLLVVRGGGDPFLVSEELDLVAAALKDVVGPLDGVAIDDSAFSPDIRVPGVGKSENPYDALNSATAVNFNTINVRVANGVVTSAESQTPLTPLAKKLALARGVQGKNRINLSANPEDIPRYAAELIAAKLRGAGVAVGDRFEIRAATGDPVYVHRSSKPLSESIKGLLHYSNNYIANQVFLAVGAHVEGGAASLAKSVRVATAWIEKHPELAGIRMTEGSGISYDNQATARSLAVALTLFAPHADLLRRKHDTPNKTGTLKVTKSVVGYLDTAGGKSIRFVISLGGGGDQTRWRIVDALRAGF